MGRIEQMAVNAVSELILACARLDPVLAVNDKTPITDGWVDVYESDKHNNATLTGRVDVQVKGRSVSREPKHKKPRASFPVDRDSLRFFRQHGGGIYFYVRISENGERSVFCLNLNPYRIDRLLAQKPATQKTFSLSFERLPNDPKRIEKLFALAVEQQKQGKTEGGDSSLLEGLRGITIHALEEISADRPTDLRLADNDFAVTIETASGLRLPFDMDLRILPSSYIEREVDVTVGCGDVEYSRAAVRRLDPDTTSIRLSECLTIRASTEDLTLNANIDLSLQGGVREQLRALNFFLAADDGRPLVINGTSHTPGAKTLKEETEVRAVRDTLARIVELFDHIGADETLVGSVELSEEETRTLLALHQALVLGEEVPLKHVEVGRFDAKVGPFRIATLIMTGTTPQTVGIIDPFDPTQRDRIRLFTTNDGGEPEEITNATVFETIAKPALADVLNIRLDRIVDAYAAVADRDVALALANQMVLTLLGAADATDGAKRERLLSASLALSEWLLETGPQRIVYSINRWQTKYRQGTLTDEDRSQIRAERRVVNRDSHDTAQLESACLSILLNDAEEVDLTTKSLTDAELTNLRSWPIWALSSNL